MEIRIDNIKWCTIAELKALKTLIDEQLRIKAKEVKVMQMMCDKEKVD